MHLCTLNHPRQVKGEYVCRPSSDLIPPDGTAEQNYSTPWGRRAQVDAGLDAELT